MKFRLTRDRAVGGMMGGFGGPKEETRVIELPEGHQPAPQPGERAEQVPDETPVSDWEPVRA